MTEECTWFSIKIDYDNMKEYGYCRLLSELVECHGDIGDCECPKKRTLEEKWDKEDRLYDEINENRGKK